MAVKRNKQDKEELRERIVGAATLAFTKSGVRNVRMDDIAVSLSISKRTLYELFRDKEQLLLEVMKCYWQEMSNYMAEVISRTENVLEIKQFAVSDVNGVFSLATHSVFNCRNIGDKVVIVNIFNVNLRFIHACICVKTAVVAVLRLYSKVNCLVFAVLQVISDICDLVSCSVFNNLFCSVEFFLGVVGVVFVGQLYSKVSCRSA